jgi:hypothetical protein
VQPTVFYLSLDSVDEQFESGRFENDAFPIGIEARPRTWERRANYLRTRIRN